jgi:hypothetical protein
MKRLSKQLNKNLLVLIVGILLMATSAFAIENIIPPDFTEQAIEQSSNAIKVGGKADLGPFVRESLRGKRLSDPKAGISGSIRGVVGGRNFTSTDVDRVMIPISTSNGPNLTDLFHDGGEWPGYGGNPSTDDGSASGVTLAQEIYDYDGNGHYPKAVLRYVGTHCYIFVPVMFFPTLPTPLSNSEDITPKAEAEWGMTWHHNPNLYYSPDSGGNVREPRFVLGTDKASAKLTLAKLATKFDTEIYPQMREYLGNEPDFDGDSKIFILLDDIRDPTGGFLGYFWAGNQFSRSEIPLSNEKELLYIDIHNFVDYPSEAYGTVAHEFAHMIMFNEGYYVENNELMGLETWVEEGITTYVEHLFTNKFSSNLDLFITNPDTRLVEDRTNVWLGNNPYANYGASFLFMYYICEKYGYANVPNFLKSIIRAREGGGIGNIEAALRTHNKTMKDVFIDWCIANSLNKTTKKDLITPLNGGKWGYLVDNDGNVNNNIGYNYGLPVALSETMLLSTDSTTRSSAVKPWAADYIRIHGNNGKLNVAFDGDDRGQFAAALIKEGPQVDSDVEILYLNDKQAGNLVVQNYGSSSTYENLTLIPIQTGNYNDQPLSYVYSGTFADLKVAVFPNPMFENHLHVVVRSESKFSSEPRVQMTYDGAQWYMVMSPIDDSTYIANYSLKNSGEGTIAASGANASGVILSNHIKFSAVYYPPKSSGSLAASFVRLNIPEGALAEGGLVVAATGENPASYGGITRVSPSIDVALPTELNKNIELLIPINSKMEFAPEKLGIYRATTDGLRWISRAKLENGNAVGELGFSGTVFAAFDDTPPALNGEPESLSDGWTRFSVLEAGSGIDEGSVKVLCNGKQVAVRITEAGELLANTSALKQGAYDFDLELKDNAGNMLSKRLRAAVAGALSVDQVVAYPNPAKNRSTIRVELTGASAATAEVSVKLYDVSGHRVLGGRALTQTKAGSYEFVWDLRNEKGVTVANGVYFAEVTVKSDNGSSKNRLKLAVLK